LTGRTPQLSHGRVPFTLSHPAAVLPLLRRAPLAASGLVAGSMAPDVPFFVESVLPGSYQIGRLAHRPWAVPTLDVAIAAGVVGVWHGLLREPLIALVPGEWGDRAEAATALSKRRRTARDAAWFAASAAIGAASHVGWDAFTHHGRTGVRLLPALERRVLGLPLYSQLQYGTSLVGLAVLGTAGARELRRTPPVPRRLEPGEQTRRRVAGVVAAATAVGAAERVARAARTASGRIPPGAALSALCFGGGAGAAVVAAGYALATRVRRTSRRG